MDYLDGRLPNLQLRLTQKYQFMTLNEKILKKIQMLFVI